MSESILNAGPDGASTADAPDPRLAHLRGQQLKLLCSQATRAPFAIAIGSLFVGYTVWNYVAPWRVAVWVLCLYLIPFARRAFALRVLRNPPADPLPALKTHLRYMFASGVATGSASILFFPSLPLERQALLTMILVCWTAGGVSTTAAYARAFYVYVVPVLAPLALVWGMLGSVEDVVVGVLIGVFGIIQTFFVSDNERVVRASFDIRYENERLIEELTRERQEAALARDAAQDADRAKSRFLAAASHDLRQPLHALSLYSAALQLRGLQGDMLEIGRSINQAVVSLSALVDSLLDISKLDAGAVEPKIQRVNIKSLLEQVESDLRPVARNKGLEFRVSTSDVEIESDPMLLERLVRNLVDNAIKYTPSGSVTLAAELTERDVRIAVRDTGPGIPVEERERIFEEFYQIGNPERDRAQGLGLGLAIVRRLAALLNIPIELETGPGQGSIFAVRLRRAEHGTRLVPKVQHATNVDRSLAGVDVLVIDDEPAVRASMRALLDSWGCRVLLCSGLNEAKQALNEQSFDVDVIVADLRLRQHENGIETVRELHSLVGQVPALLVSGDTAPERLREAQASGLPLLHKPVSAARLQEALLDVLKR